MFCELPYEVQYPLGRFVEMIPYATMGIMLWLLSQKIKKRVMFFICGSVGLLFYLLYKPKYYAPGFGYSGLMLMIGSISLIMIFLLC